LRTDDQVWADIVAECRIVNSGQRSGVIIRKDAELTQLRAIATLAKDYIEGRHDYYLQNPTIRGPIAEKKRDALCLVLGLDTETRM